MLQQIKNSISFLMPLMVFAIMVLLLSVEGGRRPIPRSGANLEESGIFFEGAGQLTASPTCRRAITSFRTVEFGTTWYGSMRLDELNRIISGCPGFNHFEQSYSSAVSWGVPVF